MPCNRPRLDLGLFSGSGVGTLTLGALAAHSAWSETECRECQTIKAAAERTTGRLLLTIVPTHRGFSETCDNARAADDMPQTLTASSL